MTTVSRLLLALPLIVALACNAPIQRPLTAGPSRDEICRAVGRDPAVDPGCLNEDPRVVVEQAFPVGVATRQQVYSALGPYFHSDQNGVEVYVIDDTFLPLYAEFTYDDQDVLADLELND